MFFLGSRPLALWECSSPKATRTKAARWRRSGRRGGAVRCFVVFFFLGGGKQEIHVFFVFRFSFGAKKDVWDDVHVFFPPLFEREQEKQFGNMFAL